MRSVGQSDYYWLQGMGDVGFEVEPDCHYAEKKKDLMLTEKKKYDQ